MEVTVGFGQISCGFSLTRNRIDRLTPQGEPWEGHRRYSRSHFFRLPWLSFSSLIRIPPTPNTHFSTACFFGKPGFFKVNASFFSRGST